MLVESDVDGDREYLLKKDAAGSRLKYRDSDKTENIQVCEPLASDVSVELAGVQTVHGLMSLE